MSNSKQLCTFYIDDLYFGVDVLSVQEILQRQTMTPVPLAPAVVSGLINLRGYIVTALDLRLLLQRVPPAEERAPMNIVVRSASDTLSFVVDKVGDVQEVKREAFESVPQNIDPALKPLLDGVYKLDQDLLLVLNVDAAVRAALPERTANA